MTLLLFVVYLSQILLMSFFATPHYVKAGFNLGLKKNPCWLEEHPDFMKNYSSVAISTVLSYIFGSLMIGLLIFAKFSDLPDIAITKVGLSAITVFVIFTLLINLYWCRLFKAIPSPQIRTTDLESRDLENYVSIYIIYLAYLLLFSIICIYLYGFYFDVIPTRLARARLVGLSIYIILLSIIRLSMRRPNYVEKAMGGRVAKKYESYCYVFVLYFGVIIGVWRIANDFFQLLILNDIPIFMFTSIAIQIGIIYEFRKIWMRVEP